MFFVLVGVVLGVELTHYGAAYQDSQYSVLYPGTYKPKMFLLAELSESIRVFPPCALDDFSESSDNVGNTFLVSPAFGILLMSDLKTENISLFDFPSSLSDLSNRRVSSLTIANYATSSISVGEIFFRTVTDSDALMSLLNLAITIPAGQQYTPPTLGFVLTFIDVRPSNFPGVSNNYQIIVLARHPEMLVIYRYGSLTESRKNEFSAGFTSLLCPPSVFHNGSGSANAISDLLSRSNVNRPGVYLFGSLGKVIPPVVKCVSSSCFQQCACVSDPNTQLCQGACPGSDGNGVCLFNSSGSLSSSCICTAFGSTFECASGLQSLYASLLFAGLGSLFGILAIIMLVLGSIVAFALLRSHKQRIEKERAKEKRKSRSVRRKSHKVKRNDHGFGEHSRTEMCEAVMDEFGNVVEVVRDEKDLRPGDAVMSIDEFGNAVQLVYV